ncbi:hypothetical protein CYQ92_11755 [Escherichia coli]|nr:hypothetical protein CYQ92_13215 [Escherichia coli]RIL19547.1 hypothetical protein CYQ92_11755 [Escherichia coli]
MDKKDYYYNPKEFRGNRSIHSPKEPSVLPFWCGVVTGFAGCFLLALYVINDKELLTKAIDFADVIKQWLAL